jgi:CRP-like cAMP-binding protein
MSNQLSVGLFDAEPDFARLVDAQERGQARRIQLPAREFDGKVELSTLFEGESHAFGALLYEGVLLHRLRVGGHETIRLLGPGDVFALSDAPLSALVAEATCLASPGTRLALLDDRVIAACRRWPRLISALAARLAEQTDRTALQLAICQLPRVADRLLALMWMLSDAWGRVTPSGVMLPLGLTHSTLGAMIGARRPTVTLALGELVDRGAVLRQGGGWLLVERPTAEIAARDDSELPELIASPPSPWVNLPGLAWAPAPDVHEALEHSLAQLRRQHVASRTQVDRCLEASRATRARVAERRVRMREQRLPVKRPQAIPPAPSS